jgi:glucosyl-3-phosphoglycerate synthase
VTRQRTFHWDDWDLETLLEHKERTGLSTSLVVPARNEAATVGDVVGRVREALVDTVQLLDEIVVIDSDSTDDTHMVATAAGAVVHRSREIRPDLGSHPGKGEAMWKSLFVARGDLIVFMDADLLDWDTHFVRGLLGPLLSSDVALVKGFYERPLQDGSSHESAYEGGRVTELVARPLIALDWPELGWLVQPLAGEWAVRRDLFERLHVPVGYAVELAALIDTHRLLGPGAIAQVDLGRRAHRHQALRDLGAMAVQILAASQRRSIPRVPEERSEGRAKRLEGIERESVLLHQHRQQAGVLDTVTHEINLQERPPARDLL